MIKKTAIFVLLTLLLLFMGCSASLLASPRALPLVRFGGKEELNQDFVNGLERFSYWSAKEVFAERAGSHNKLYSPLSLYMALSLATQGAGGDTQKELLGALGAGDLSLLQEQTGKVYRNLYRKSGISKLTLANSVWLNKGFSAKREYLTQAAKSYYAYAYRLDFADQSAGQSVGGWVQKQTNGKVGDEGSVQINPQDAMLLINTVYFKDQWVDQFEKNNTRPGDFYRSDGSTVTCNFMNATYSGHPFARLPDCTVSALAFKGGQSMVLVLPDKGVSPYDIASDPRKLAEAIGVLSGSDVQKSEVVFSVPKFTFKDKMDDLIEPLKRMGVQKAFGATADFSGISDIQQLFIS